MRHINPLDAYPAHLLIRKEPDVSTAMSRKLAVIQAYVVDQNLIALEDALWAIPGSTDDSVISTLAGVVQRSKLEMEDLLDSLFSNTHPDGIWLDELNTDTKTSITNLPEE